MHNGSIETLEQVIEFYAAGDRTGMDGEEDKQNNPEKRKQITGFELSDVEKSDLIKFLQSLTSSSLL